VLVETLHSEEFWRLGGGTKSLLHASITGGERPIQALEGAVIDYHSTSRRPPPLFE
jgi:hypothetical protein